MASYSVFKCHTHTTPLQFRDSVTGLTSETLKTTVNTNGAGMALLNADDRLSVMRGNCSHS